MQKRKSAPFPVFNRTKRPRQALFAHPNSIMSQERQYESRLSSFSEEQSTHCGSLGGARGCTLSQQQNTNKIGFGVNTENPVHHTVGNQANYKQLDHGRRIPLTPLQQHYQQPTRHPDFSHLEPHVSSSLQPSDDLHQLHTSIEPIHWSLQSTGKTESNIARTESPASRSTAVSRSAVSSKSTPSMRVLTSTAQGIHYWTQCCSLPIVLLFEVFGVLDSQVSVGDYGSKQFMLKAGDGVLKCCFWEMDIKLPHLVRGQSHRVVGTWDVRNKFMKCASVRPTFPNEERHVPVYIEASNGVMRELTSVMSEI